METGFDISVYIPYNSTILHFGRFPGKYAQ